MKRKIKLVISLLLIVVIAISVVGCGSKGDDPSPSDLSSDKETFRETLLDKETLNTRVPIFLKTIYGNEKGVGTLNSNGKYYVKINLYNNSLKVRQIEICIENQ